MKTSTTMTTAELLGLPVSVPLWPTAARAFGLGRTTAYDLAKRGALPFPVLRLGNSYRVTRADLLRSLGVDQTDGGSVEQPNTATSRGAA